MVHIDDFVLCGDTEIECQALESTFDDLLDELNVEISSHKSIHACQQAELYGIWWDLDLQTLSIPDKQFKKLKNFIKLVIKYRCITGRAMESISGAFYIYFICFL